MAPSREGRRESSYDQAMTPPSSCVHHSRQSLDKADRDHHEHHSSSKLKRRDSDRAETSPSHRLERSREEASDRKRSRRSRSRERDRRHSHRSQSRERKDRLSPSRGRSRTPSPSRERKERRTSPKGRSRTRSVSRERRERRSPAKGKSRTQSPSRERKDRRSPAKGRSRTRSPSRDRKDRRSSPKGRSGSHSHDVNKERHPSRSPSRERKKLKSLGPEDSGYEEQLKEREKVERHKERERSPDTGLESEKLHMSKRGSEDTDMKEEGEIQEEGNPDFALDNGVNQQKDGKKSEPLSLEEILKRKKEEATQQAKPVFLTKAEREKLAMQRREEEVSEQRRRLEEQRKLFAAPDSNSRKDQDDRDRLRDREREREHERERERERERDRERRERDREREEEAKIREKERQEKQMTREREKELEAIKEQYLGAKKLKKRVVKPSEKFRFSFDWENTEDTSRDMNPIYQNPHEAQLLFGRGFRAGMDRREQKKLAAKNEKDLRAEIRRKDGVQERPEEAEAQKQKEEAANVYDTFDMRVDRHWSEKKIEEMTERDWRIFREDFNISYKGSRIPRPMRNWEEGALSTELLKSVAKAGYKKPSPIQMAAIPIGLQQRDVIGIAETGSGKTAAFVLPMLTYISKLPPMTEEIEAEGPYAVVMAPTRELAQQIEEETVKFAHYLDIRVVSIVGGQSIEEQGFKLRQGCEIVIATPGRLLDCLERRYAVLNQCNYVVLDEADRMIDMGFEPQVVGVLDAMPSSNLKPDNEDAELDEKRIYRTTYMFSATMPPAVERLARKYLRNPVVVTIGTAGKATDLITQHVMMLKETEKLDRLQRVLNDMGEKTAIIFVNTKKSADSLSRQLDRGGYRVTTLHGGKTQEQREISLEGFRNKRYNCLVATDVAGRGIDIPDVAHVINFDMPNNIEQYTHRIGRTGRAGKTGIATTFLTVSDSEVFYDLKQMLIQSNSPVPPELARHEASKFKPGSVPDRPARRNDTVYAH
ncbi:unnamed protein product [Calypogeia fissa]